MLTKLNELYIRKIISLIPSYIHTKKLRNKETKKLRLMIIKESK